MYQAPVDCGAPRVDWKNIDDSKAPKGWTTVGLTGNAGDSKNCADGWNGYARLKAQGQLFATMKGYGRATVKYSDCYGEGFATLHLNGKQLDSSPKNTGEVRTFRYVGSLSFIRKLADMFLHAVITITQF